MKCKLIGFSLAFVVLSAAAGLPFLAGGQDSQDRDPHATGLKPVTAAQMKMMRETWPRVRKVGFNILGLERLNKARLEKGLWPLDRGQSSPFGRETETEVGEPPAAEALGENMIGAPTSVDNSTLPSFPPVRSQGSLGSCASFAITYYQLTNLHALLRGWSEKNTDDTIKFSPKWAYNMVNGGSNSGSYFSDNYALIQKHGAVKWSEFPYDSNYLAWCLDTAAWRNAIPFRTNPVQYVGSVSTSGLQQVKDLLVNGYVLIIGTYINSWQYTTIKDDPSTTEDDAYVGKNICFWMNGTNGAHGMTVVGYNDGIWTDINGNGTVDTGEKGALRIANSWGTGWGEAGFVWLAYDALRATSLVPGGPGANRLPALQGDYAYHLTAPPNYQPRMIAEFTVHHAARNQLRMSLGVSDTTASTPAAAWYPGAISFQGGAYAFNGTTTAVDGTFAFDFSDILPSGSSLKRYYVGTYDSASGNIATLKAAKIIDLTTAPPAETPATNVPQTSDNGQQVYASMDYSFYDGNSAPVASASAAPTTGPSPLTVNLSGAGSYDPDGSIASHSWNFGDGSTGSGVSVNHTYTNTTGSDRTYTAVLTVTDNVGATGSDSVIITVKPDPAFIGAPTNLTAKAIGRTVSLTWKDNSSNESGFDVERGIKTGKTINFTRVQTTGPNAVAAAVAVSAAGTYYFRVRAFNTVTGRVSAYSNQASVRVK